MRFSKTAAIAFCFVPALISSANAFNDRGPSATLPEISEPTTPKARSEYNEIISQFASDVPDGSIKFSEDHHPGGPVFIRLEDERFCVVESCVTIVTTRCGIAMCQYAPVVVPNRYYIESIGGRFWGNIIIFPLPRSGGQMRLCSTGASLPEIMGFEAAAREAG